MITGKALTICKNSGGVSSTPSLVGFLWGIVYTGSSGALIGSSGSSSIRYVYGCVSDYFSFSNGNLTCKKAGSYNLTYFGRCGQGTTQVTGPAVNTLYQIYLNDSRIVNTTNSTLAGFSGSTTNITINVDDYIRCFAGRNSGSTANYFDFGVAIYLPE